MTIQPSRLFINRGTQRKEVSRILDALPGLPSPLSGLEFYGIAGSGKSRMLDLAKEECRTRQLSFALVDLSMSGKFDIESSQNDLLLRICDTLDCAEIPTGSAREIVNLMIQHNAAEMVHEGEEHSGDSARGSERKAHLIEFRKRLVQALAGKPFILYLENTHYCPDRVFDWIGEELIGPLSTSALNGCVLFLSGRGPRVRDSRWSGSARAAIHSFRLDPFDIAYTQEHIAQLQPGGEYTGAAKTIYQFSNGHPYSTEALVAGLHSMGTRADAVGGQRLALARCLYEEVIQHYILRETEDWVLPLLETACIPRRFDAGFLEFLGPQYRPRSTPNHSVEWYIVRMDDLRRRPLNLIDVGDSNPAYKLDRTFRQLLHTALAILTPDETAEMHKQCCVLYTGRLKPLTNRDHVSSAAVILEIMYHTAAREAILDQPPLPPTQRELEQSLRGSAGSDTDINLLFADNLKALLGKEGELKELVGQNGIDLLIAIVDRVLTPPPLERTRVYLSVEREMNEYRTTLMREGVPVLPSERVPNPRRYSPERWRAEKEQVGRAAFQGYLPQQAQQLLSSAENFAIQLNTNTTDIYWELCFDGKEFLSLARPVARKPMLLKPPRVHSENRGQLRVLVIGNPTDDLPATVAEAQAVTQLFQTYPSAMGPIQVDTFIGSAEASAEDFVLRITNSKYDLIHYAGHASFNRERPALSGLHFDDGAVYAEELEHNLNSRAFLYLSACEGAVATTGTVGIGYYGDLMEGLAVNALLGGAMGCLGPLWEIPDDLASAFAIKFYQELLHGQPIGEALRLARLFIRDLAPESDIWASWVLYGEPMQKLRENF